MWCSPCPPRWPSSPATPSPCGPPTRRHCGSGFVQHGHTVFGRDRIQRGGVFFCGGRNFCGLCIRGFSLGRRCRLVVTGRRRGGIVLGLCGFSRPGSRAFAFFARCGRIAVAGGCRIIAARFARCPLRAVRRTRRVAAHCFGRRARCLRPFTALQKAGKRHRIGTARTGLRCARGRRDGRNTIEIDGSTGHVAHSRESVRVDAGILCCPIQMACQIRCDAKNPSKTIYCRIYHHAEPAAGRCLRGNICREEGRDCREAWRTALSPAARWGIGSALASGP